MNWLDIAIGLIVKDLIQIVIVAGLIVAVCVIGFVLDRLPSEKRKAWRKR